MFDFPYKLRAVAQFSHGSDISELMEEFADRRRNKRSTGDSKPSEKSPSEKRFEKQMDARRG